MYILALNLRATKRLYFHQVLEPDGTLVFTSKHADECFDWLYEHDEREFILNCQGCRYRVDITKLAE